jgi:hypothetical protein
MEGSMSEELNQEVVEEQKPSEGNPDIGPLIAESKKYRSRAQAAEEELARIKAAQKEAEEAKLAEQGEYKTLLEQKEEELKALSAKATEWDNFQATRREQILEGWSDDQKENFGDLPLTKLEALNKQFKLEQGGGKAPQDRPGTSKTGQKYNGHSSLKEWAIKDKESFRKRNGDYPG